jgi:hypothetical protein
MKKFSRRALILAIALALGLALWTALTRTSRRISIAIGENEPLSEQLALDVSKQALQKTGLLTPQLAPAPYREGKYFARNVEDENSGYTIWYAGGDGSSGYTVRLSRSGDAVDCNISPITK